MSKSVNFTGGFHYIRIYSFHKYLLHPYYLTANVLGIGDTVGKTWTSLCCPGACILVGETADIQVFSVADGGKDSRGK